MAPPDVICIGGATVDVKYRALGPLRGGTSNPARGERGFGGVARNICENLARLGILAGLSTLVGDDGNGRALVAQLKAAGADTGLVTTMPGLRTAEYVAILEPDGSLALGIADMAIFDAFGEAELDRLRPGLADARWAIADANLPAAILDGLVASARDAPFRLAVDPVSVAKAARLPADLSGIDLLVLNRDEAAAILGASGEPMAMARALRARGAAAVVVTDGPEPLSMIGAGGGQEIAAVAADVVDVTGSGDALIAAIVAGLLCGRGLADAVRTGVRVAAATAESPRTVRDDLTPDMLEILEGSIA